MHRKPHFKVTSTFTLTPSCFRCFLMYEKPKVCEVDRKCKAKTHFFELFVLCSCAHAHTHTNTHRKETDFQNSPPRSCVASNSLFPLETACEKVEDEERRTPRRDREGVREVRGREEEGGGGGAVWLANNPLSLVMSWDQANPTFTD